MFNSHENECMFFLFFFHSQPVMQNKPYQLPNKPNHASQETNFDIDGHVETVGGVGQGPPQDRLPGTPQHAMSDGPSHGRVQENLLPAAIEFPMEGKSIMSLHCNTVGLPHVAAFCHLVGYLCFTHVTCLLFH